MKFARHHKIEPSSLDARVPPEAEVVYQLFVPSTQRNVPPRMVFQSTSQKVAQDASDSLWQNMALPHGFQTVWRHRETKVKIHKWDSIRTGTNRKFIVTVPWVKGMSDAKVIKAVRVALADVSLKGKVTVVPYTKPLKTLEDTPVTGDNRVASQS